MKRVRILISIVKLQKPLNEKRSVAGLNRLLCSVHFAHKIVFKVAICKTIMPLVLVVFG